jgi:hypothetical protein
MCCILYYGFYSDEVIGLVDSRSSVLEIQKHPTMDSAPSMFPRQSPRCGELEKRFEPANEFRYSLAVLINAKALRIWETTLPASCFMKVFSRLKMHQSHLWR